MCTCGRQDNTPGFFLTLSYENNTKLSISLELQGRRRRAAGWSQRRTGSSEGIGGQEGLGNTWSEGQVGAEGQSRPGRRRRRAPGRQSASAPLHFGPPPTPPGGQDAVHPPRRWLRWDHEGAAWTGSRAPARPPPTPRPPAPCLPGPSPSSSRWMMLSMLSLSISAIASQWPGGPLPAAPLPPLAA